MRYFLILSLLLITACAERPALVEMPKDGVAGRVRPVFVATSRLPEGTEFGALRSETLGYARFDISVPQNREAGEIETPEGTPDPKRHFLLSGRTNFANQKDFRAAVSRALLRRAPADRETIIYVHGFNSRFAEGVLRIAQLSEDIGLPGVEVHYSWPSAGTPLGYIYDSDSALFGRDGLESLIDTIERAGSRRIVIVAHSLGSLVTMEALRQIDIARPGRVARIIDGVVLISPDLDIDVFRMQAHRIRRLPRTFAIFTSTRDRALKLSARLTGLRERLGNVEDPDRLADLDVVLLDVTAFSRGAGHFTPGNSQGLISILSQASAVGNAFGDEAGSRAGLLPGTVITVRNATQVILDPTRALRR